MDITNNCLIGIAILAITLIELTAIIFLKIDGVLLSGIVAVIAGIATKTYIESKQGLSVKPDSPKICN